MKPIVAFILFKLLNFIFLRKSNFTKYLDSLTDDELKEELDKLYSKYKSVKDYYAMELGNVDDRKKLLDRAKNGIGRLYERRKTRSRLSKVNTILKEISLISIFDHELAKVYIHHVECATSHINYYGLRREADANHLATSFKKSVDLITSSQTKEDNAPRLEKVLERLHRFYSLTNELGEYMDENLI